MLEQQKFIFKGCTTEKKFLRKMEKTERLSFKLEKKIPIDIN